MRKKLLRFIKQFGKPHTSEAVQLTKYRWESFESLSTNIYLNYLSKYFSRYSRSSLSQAYI